MTAAPPKPPSPAAIAATRRKLTNRIIACSDNIERERGEGAIAQMDSETMIQIARAKLDSAERQVGARLDSEERSTNLVQAGKREMFNAEAALRVRTGQGI